MKTFIVLFLCISPLKPDLTFRFKDISISQALATFKRYGGSNLELPFEVEGRIKMLVVEMRDFYLTVKATGIQTHNDAAKPQPVETVLIIYQKKTRDFYAKACALGGIVEITGVLPPEQKKR